MLAAVVNPTVPQSGAIPSSRWQNNRGDITESGRHADVHERISQGRAGIAQSVVSGRVQAAQSRREQTDRRSRKNSPDIERIFVPEPAGLKERRRDNIPKCEEGNRRRHDEERDLPKAAVHTIAQKMSGIEADIAGHGWERRG